MKKFAIALSALICFAALPAAAQEWPTRPVRILVGAPPGGLTDILARMLQDPLTQAFGQPVVVENKPGGSGILAVETLVRERNDHQALIVVSSLASAPALGIRTPYDVARDVAPVTLIGRIPLLIAAHPSAGISNVQDLVRVAKARPGQLNYGTPGIGLAQHFSGELLKSMAGLDMVHVPYRGAGPVNNDLVGGQIPLAIVSPSSIKGFVDAGRARAVAVTGPTRLAMMPDVPTVAEAGVAGFAITEWYGVAMAAGAPPAAIARLNQTIRAFFSTPERTAWRDGVAMQGGLGTPQEFATFIREETAKLTEIARAANIKPE